MAVKDELREEEVLACVVLKRPDAGERRRRGAVRHCYERLAYYKAPGWMHIVETLPTTGTQKIQKHSIYGAGTDPRNIAGIIDLRAARSAHDHRKLIAAAPSPATLLAPEAGAPAIGSASPARPARASASA
jgi:hypothetical protein